MSDAGDGRDSIYTEPQSGGLIDKYWIMYNVITPLIFIFIAVGLFHVITHSRPYIEDVSSCFPYNLPRWVQISIPLLIVFLILCCVILYLKIRKFGVK